MKQALHFVLNGESRTVEADPTETLLTLLRETLGLTGTKKGCGAGECGACTVILNGEAINSCLVMAGQIEGASILTVEGLEHDGKLDRLQQAFIDHHAVQCGFCTSGMLMSAKALLMKNPSPSEKEIRTALSGNICRCTGYNSIVDAVQAAAEAAE